MTYAHIFPVKLSIKRPSETSLLYQSTTHPRFQSYGLRFKLLMSTAPDPGVSDFRDVVNVVAVLRFAKVIIRPFVFLFYFFSRKILLICMNVKYGEQFLCFFVTTTVYNLYSLDSLREKKKMFSPLRLLQTTNCSKFLKVENVNKINCV